MSMCARKWQWDQIWARSRSGFMKLRLLRLQLWLRDFRKWKLQLQLRGLKMSNLQLCLCGLKKLKISTVLIFKPFWPAPGFAFWTEKRYFFQDSGKNLSKTYFFRFLPSKTQAFFPGFFPLFEQSNRVFFHQFFQVNQKSIADNKTV